jgi:catechol 2,3-dioxygenase-like lactoylglutathione lyase family enzyme
LAVLRYLVRDVDAALAFYIDKLGFALIERWGPPFAMVGRGDLTLWLSGPGSSASRTLADGSVPQPGGWNRLVLETDDLGSLVERLRSSGVRFRSEIVAGPGGKQILVDDPSGNPIELFEPTGE